MGSIGDGEYTIDNSPSEEDDYMEDNDLLSPINHSDVLVSSDRKKKTLAEIAFNEPANVNNISDPLDKFDTLSDTDRINPGEGSNWGDQEELHDESENSNLYGHLGYTQVAKTKQNKKALRKM
jgi:hypothetical protein